MDKYILLESCAPDYPETAIAVKHLSMLETQYGVNGPSIQLRGAILKMHALAAAPEYKPPTQGATE